MNRNDATDDSDAGIAGLVADLRSRASEASGSKLHVQLGQQSLELLVVGLLLAAFTGVLLPPVTRAGINVVPLGVFGGVVAVGVYVVRVVEGTAPTQRLWMSRMRVNVLFVLVGALLGAVVGNLGWGTVEATSIGALAGFLAATQLVLFVEFDVQTREDVLEDVVEDKLAEYGVDPDGVDRPRPAATENAGSDASDPTDEEASDREVRSAVTRANDDALD